VGKLTDQSWMTLVQRRGSRDETHSLKSRLQLTPLTLSTQLGEAIVQLRDIVSLEKGSVLVLNDRRDQDLKVKVNKKLKFWGTPGISNGRNAIKIARRISPYEEVVHE
jgi:flagellar motor switch protein FliM